MSNQKIVTETALSALASDIKTALSGKANSNDVYPKSQTYNRTEIDNALELKADKSELYNVYPTDQENGAIAHFTDGADNIPVKSLVSEIVAVETGNGQPKSPTNPYTISGFDSGVVSVCGKNIWSEGNLSFTTSQTVNFTSPKSALTISGKWQTEATATCLVIFYNGSTEITRNWFVADGTTKSFSYNFTTPITSIVFFSGDNYVNSNGKSATITDFQIEKGDTATTYEAYNGNTYTFTFGQTVYGGHFDNKGNLVVTHGMLDLGSVNWQYNPSLNVFVYNLSDMPLNTTLLCEQYEYTNVSRAENIGNNQIWNRGYALMPHNILIKDTRYTDFAAFKAAVSGVKLVYELANPITLAITSQDIPTLLGENNIFSNTGDVEVDYHADIGLYIDKKISSLAQG